VVLPDAAVGAFGETGGCEVLERDGGAGECGVGSGGGGEAVSVEKEKGWARVGDGAGGGLVYLFALCPTIRQQLKVAGDPQRKNESGDSEQR
jgi:hypothetical protein